MFRNALQMDNCVNVGVIQVNNKRTEGQSDRLIDWQRKDMPRQCPVAQGFKAFPSSNGQMASAYQIALHLFIIITTVKSLNSHLDWKPEQLTDP